MSASTFDPNLPDTNKSLGILVVGWLECAIGTILLVGRIYSRTKMQNTLGSDDWTMMIAWVGSLTEAIQLQHFLTINLASSPYHNYHRHSLCPLWCRSPCAIRPPLRRLA